MHLGLGFGPRPGEHELEGTTDQPVYPAPPGVPPSLTIAALAERQAELLTQELGA